MSSVASAMCWTPEPNSSLRKREASVWRLCEALRTRRRRRPATRTTWLCTTPPGSSTSCDARLPSRRGARCRTEARSASPRSASTARDGRSRTRPGIAGAGRRATGLEIDLPEAGRARSSGRRNREGCRRGRAPPGCRARPGRPPGGTAGREASTARSIVADASSTRSAMAQTDEPCVMLKEWAKPSFSRVDDDVDVALPPAVDGLRLVLAGLGEAEAARAALSKSTAAVLVHRELDELDARHARARRQRRQARHRRRRSGGAARRA